MDDTAAGTAPSATATGRYVERVAVTPSAAHLLRELRAEHGPLMFHQSGGCCDGSAPMCYPLGDFIVGAADMFLGELDVSTATDAVEPIPFYMSRPQFEYWSHTHLTVDVVPGRGAGFSLEAPTGRRFIIQSRLFTGEEAARLEAGADGAHPAG